MTTSHPKTRQRAVRPPAKARWESRTETASLQLSKPLLTEARANTRLVARDVVFLSTLAREIALSRGPELTLAYRNLVWVVPGYRRKTVKPRAKSIAAPSAPPRTRISDEVCIVFVVRRKGSVEADSAQHLPRWLIHFADHQGSRKPFAIPTDVQDSGDFHSAVPQGNSAVEVKHEGWTSNGHFAGLVQVDHAAGTDLCVLSALHVLTPHPSALVLATGPQVDLRAGSSAEPKVAPFAWTRNWGGQLRADQNRDKPSFDVQLARVEDESAARARNPLRKLHPDMPWVGSMAELELLDQKGYFYLLTPDNHPTEPGRGEIRLTLRIKPATAMPIPYLLADSAQACDVFHEELLYLETTSANGPAPIKGDSGSAIVARDGNDLLTLVGMHIGGDGVRLSFAIPAWRLFNLDNWLNYPGGARLKLL